MNNLIKSEPCLTVDLKSLEKNFFTVRNLCKGKKICAVVKADAYGHGSLEVSRLYEKLGVSYLAVANLDEAVFLRLNGINSPLLILGHTPLERINELVKYSISQCVYSYEYAKLLSNSLTSKIKVHVKIDTGMSRLGLSEKFAVSETLDLVKLKNLHVEGAYTHLSCADLLGFEYDAYTLSQLEKFTDVLETLKVYGVEFEYSHALNSAGILRYNYCPFNMVRAGLILYGVSPLEKFSDFFTPAVKLTSPVTQVKKIKRGQRVGYGGKKLISDKIVAVIPVGYADGIFRRYANDLKIEINGKPFSIIGNICMDQIIVDVTGVVIKSGDIATVLGGEFNSITEISRSLDTIPYEIFCSIGKRIKKIYIS